MNQLFYDRIEADYLSKLEIFWLKKRGLLRGYCSSSTIVWKQGEHQSSIGIEVNLLENLREYLLGKEVPKDGFVRIMYKLEDQKYDYNVQLTTTDCNYGRFRYWFNCPHCSRRVGVLYFRRGYFACRHCNYLTYESKMLSGWQKGIGRIISEPKLNAMQNEVKRKYYDGKITRKYQRYLTMEERSETAFIMSLHRLAPNKMNTVTS